MQQQVPLLPTLSSTRYRLFSGFSGRVLDLGCGTAAETIKLAVDKGCRLYCVDVKGELLNQARKIAKNLVDDNIEFIIADINDISFPSSYFDVIIFKSSLHHLSKWKDVLHRVRGWLKSGGIIYLEEPLRTNPIATVGTRMYYSIASPFLEIHQRPDPDQWPFDSRELLEEVRKHFDIEHISFHEFISTLFNKAANYARHPLLRYACQSLSNATLGLDFLFQSSPTLQRYCSMIIVMASKNNY